MHIKTCSFQTHALPEELGRDATSVNSLLRNHQNFMKDLDAIEGQVRQIQHDAKGLQVRFGVFIHKATVWNPLQALIASN